MRVKIQDPAVRQNVQFLVDVLPKTEGAVWETEQKAHAVVKASFDRETGQFLPEKGGRFSFLEALISRFLFLTTTMLRSVR